MELHMPLLTEGDVPDDRVPVLNAGISRINHILFGPQDYAVIARKLHAK